MRGYIDLHCHWVAGIDDGARSTAESIAMLRALRDVGFDRVCATPHMRPGMFENTAAELVLAFEATSQAIEGASGLPERMLSSEHWFDDIVFQRLVEGRALPYPGGHAALVEVPPRAFPARLADRLADLKRRGLRPVLAHPERYEPVWDDLHVLDASLDCGTVLLLDVAALAGKYGRTPRRAAETLLDEGYYYAACSDAHRPADADEVARGIERLIELIGGEEATFLLREGPLDILEGRVMD
jgi:protein-tyrosine phosphatase